MIACDLPPFRLAMKPTPQASCSRRGSNRPLGSGHTGPPWGRTPGAPRSWFSPTVSLGPVPHLAETPGQMLVRSSAHPFRCSSHHSGGEQRHESRAEPTPPLHWAASVMPLLIPVSRFGRISQSVIGGRGPGGVYHPSSWPSLAGCRLPSLPQRSRCGALHKVATNKGQHS